MQGAGAGGGLVGIQQAPHVMAGDLTCSEGQGSVGAGLGPVFQLVYGTSWLEAGHDGTSSGSGSHI